MPKGIYKHKPQSEESKRKRSLTMKGRTPKNIMSIAGWNKGKKGLVKATKEQKTRRSEMAKDKGFGKWMSKKLEKESNNWKGEKVKYRGLHMWIQKMKGTPDICEHCGKTGLKGKKIQWANKSHEYKRDLEDWIRLCTICHRKYDKKI